MLAVEKSPALFRFVSSVAWIAFLSASVAATAQEESVAPGINDSFENPDPDRYVERFEGESRVIYRFREAIVAALGLEPGMDVADVGAGTGFFSRMMAAWVGPEGKVYSVDIAKNFLDHIEKTSREAGLNNIETVLCDQKSTRLAAESVDLIFITDTYHHFEFPMQTLASIHQALRPGGTLVIIDFERIKGVSAAFAISHVRCGKGTVTDEVKDAGFDFIGEIPMMEEQYFIKFKKR